MIKTETSISPDQMTAGYVMSPISPEHFVQAARGWNVSINGETVPQVTSLELIQANMLTDIKYGQRSEGYDSITIRESGGGGSVVIPYMVHPETGAVFVGLVEEDRPLIGGKVLNVPRGFVNPGETHLAAAERELQEESGYVADGSRITELAEGLNPNSSYFDTSHSESDGVAIFAARIDYSELETSADAEGNLIYVFPMQVQNDREVNELTEHILGFRFVPVETARLSRDMFTSAAVGQLMLAMFAGDIPYNTTTQL